jgi:hypothetical protein
MVAVSTATRRVNTRMLFFIAARAIYMFFVGVP